VSDAALAHLALDDLLDELLVRIRDALEGDTCAFLLLDPPAGELVARAARGLEEEVEAGVRIPVGRGFAGRIAAERRPVLIEDLDHADIFNPILRQKGLKSIVGAPLIAYDELLGVVHVGTLQRRVFTPLEIELLEVAAQRAALAISHALAHEEILRLGEVQRDFVSLAAHELRTPATTVYGLTATLQNRRDSLDPAVVEELEQALYKEADRMRRLVDQLLDLSRLDSATVSIQRRPLMLRDTLEGIAQAAAPGTFDEVTLEVPADLEANLDPAALERIIGNLVANAFRYGEPPIVVSAEQRDRHIRIAVEDRGIGVGRDFVPFLFERFKRSEGSQHRAVGTGLGLAIARSYAQAHGGDLLYEAASPRGARFELVVPAEPNGP
jgi:signal transduction histidine kinase